MSSTSTGQPAANTVNHHTKSAGYRPDIDGLRALAVFAVFIFHAFPKAMRGGFVGVDIFFVISGFLISSIIFSQLESGSFSFWNFYSRRIRRIYPTLITVLLACLGFGWFYLLSDEYAQLGKHVAGGAGFISNFLLWFESGYFDNAAETKPLLHLWSLGIEEQFYIIWPLLLWLLWKKRFNLLVVSFVLAVVSFGLNLYFYHADPIADFFSPQTRFWELLCGAMLAWISLHPAQLTLKPGLFYRETTIGETPDFYTRFFRYRHILSSAGALLLVLSIVFVKQTASRNYPGIWAVFPVLATMLLIAAGKDGWFNKQVLSNKVLVWFGLISYPLYLWHWPLLAMARIVLLDEPPLWWRITVFPVGILLAWITTRFIENPLRFGKYGNIKTVLLFVLMFGLG
ncbi:MAG: acyltransferase, partial [Oxalobacter sp.]|nr:acyltransferase [Oxalobacter sp.]